jgi:RAQPRD family integrative conjugative element protein
MLRIFILISTVWVATIQTSLAEQQNFSEREVLEQIYKEIVYLRNQKLTEAKTYSDENARLKLRYSDLDNDFKKIEEGLYFHLYTLRPQPRNLSAIPGNAE